MKSILLLFTAAASLMSCTTTRHHLTVLSPPPGYTGEQPHIRQHEAVTVEYDFTLPDNQVGFLVYNHLKEDLYLDFTRSSLIINDLAVPYYHGTTDSRIQLQSGDMPLYSENLSNLSLTGSSSAGSMGAAVLIPAETRVNFQRMTLPVPLIPQEQQLRREGRLQVSPARVEAEVGGIYRHRLALVPADPSLEPFFVEDSFVVVSNILVTQQYYLSNQARLNNPSKLTSRRTILMADPGASFMALMASAGAFFAILIWAGSVE